MAGKIYANASDNIRFPRIKEAKAFCEARLYHAGDGVSNPVTGNPYDGDGTAEETAWDAGWQARENGDAKGSCAE